MEPSEATGNGTFAPLSEERTMNRRDLALHVRPAGLLPYLGAILAAVVGSGCAMENAYDVYLEGLRIAGAAENGPCALAYDQSEQAHVLSSGKIQQCISEVEQALELYEKAHAMGHEGQDVEANIKDTKHKLERLRAMVRTIKRIEVDQEVEARAH